MSGTKRYFDSNTHALIKHEIFCHYKRSSESNKTNEIPSSSRCQIIRNEKRKKNNRNREFQTWKSIYSVTRIPKSQAKHSALVSIFLNDSNKLNRSVVVEQPQNALTMNLE